MRKLMLCLSAAAVAAFACGRTLLLDRKLDDFAVPAAQPVSGVPVWDLSAAETTSVPEARYDCYGDSLLSEICNGYRLWHSLSADSAFYIGEEAPLMIMAPRVPVAAVMPGTSYTSTDAAYECDGMYSRMFPVGERGFFKSSDLGAGLLVLAPGDTVKSRLICEERIFTALPEDSTVHVSHETRRWRWYAMDGSRLPLAVGVEHLSRDINGRQIESASTAYVVDARSYREKKRRERETDDADTGRERIEAISRALTDASVEYRDGAVRVSVTAPEGVTFELTADITDEGGILFRHESAAVAGSCTLEISTAGMPAHAYIVILTAEGITEKRMVAIW